MNKVIYVKAHFAKVGKSVTRKIETGEKKAGLLWGENKIYEEVTEWEETGFSDCLIDGQRLNEDIAKAVADLNAEGYEVVTVTSFISGNWACNYASNTFQNGGWGWGYGYGYSFTDGVTIIAKKMAQNV